MICAIIFAAVASFILYVLFGYPIVLYVLAAICAKPVKRSPQLRTVSILIGVHNGARFVEEKLQSIFALDFPQEQIVEIILACDGCTDGTPEIAKRVGGDRIRVLSLPKGGKAIALNEAMKVATGEILVFNDIRQRVDPDCLRYLLESFADPRTGAVSGQLVIVKGNTTEEQDVGLYWKYEFWVRTQLSRLDSIFGATGACYALRRELAVPIPPEALLDDMYEPLAAFFEGYRLVVDERARVFDYPTGLESEFYRKVRTLAGNYQILAVYPQLLGPQNRLWFHFVSYKFGRLLLPLALVVLAVSSMGLPWPFSIVALGGQVVVYLLGAIDPWIVDRTPIKRVTSIVRTFVVLMLATAYATQILFRPAKDLWVQTNTARPGS